MIVDLNSKRNQEDSPEEPETTPPGPFDNITLTEEDLLDHPKPRKVSIKSGALEAGTLFLQNCYPRLLFLAHLTGRAVDAIRKTRIENKEE